MIDKAAYIPKYLIPNLLRDEVQILINKELEGRLKKLGRKKKEMKRDQSFSVETWKDEVIRICNHRYYLLDAAIEGLLLINGYDLVPNTKKNWVPVVLTVDTEEWEPIPNSYFEVSNKGSHLETSQTCWVVCR